MSELLTALAIGAAFGFALERAGLGDPNKLSGQFYLRDFTVFKVMMTAIVTAMLGLFWLGRLGVVPLGALYVPETFLLPQAVGGLIFGAGFVLCGLCPTCRRRNWNTKSRRAWPFRSMPSFTTPRRWASSPCPA